MPLADISAVTKLTGLFGHPVSHSRSPEIHQAWIAQNGLDARYLAFDVAPETLVDAVAGLRAMRLLGVNLTVPHKEAVLPYVDVIDDAAKKIGAANTLHYMGEVLYATNTDAYGFIENLRAQCTDLTPHLEQVLVLGAGGAARAVLYALKQAGAAHIIVANRTKEKAEKLAEEFGTEVANWDHLNPALTDSTLLVNTTSLGMEGQLPLPVTLDALPQEALVHDIVYAPLHTELLKTAQARGNKVATGLGMLYYQAQAAFELWHGVKPTVALP